MLADVMKQVIQEALQGSAKVVSNRKVSNAPSRRTSSVSTGPEGIKRPNYQQLKKEKNIAFLKGPNKAAINRTNVTNRSSAANKSATPSRPARTSNNQPSRTGSMNTSRTSSNNSSTLSKFHSFTLAQGNVPRRNNVLSSRNTGNSNAAKIIGKTKDGGCVWFFTDLQNGLMNSFQRPLNGASVGVIKMPKCLPSHLLLINEIVRNNQDLKFHISWENDGDAPFTAELYDNDAQRLEKNMNEIFTKLNRRSLKQCEAYTEASPSTWLSKQLNINGSVDAVAFLEGVSYYTSIVLMDSLLNKNNGNSLNDFDYKINDNYLLLQGKHNVISKLVNDLKKEASQLISSDMTI